ncbi:hypothetical protein [Bacillus cereus]|uniref:hypothetical protein n=1 Tax=Bacillus cereus TaxID=1396 RepID=UPI000BFD33A3|nr:hypothetical protein [Bacillus cereus]PGU82130.1 hypothetical protein COD76_11595 [Bacillus cereus]
MEEYMGIKLDKSVKLYKKDGNYNKQVKNGLDALAELLDKNGHVITSSYIGDKGKILIDFECGHEPHLISPSNYKKGKGCPKCSGRCSEQSKKVLIESAEKNGHELLSGYINEKTAVLINFHCGHDAHWISPEKYKMNQGCSKCGEIKRSESKRNNSSLQFSSLVQENGHELLSPYVDIYSKVLIDFQCGHNPHLISPNDYRNSNTRCPLCSTSKGVRIICEQFLDVNNIPYMTEYKFPIHANSRSGFRYDIIVPYDNLIIEVHGGQHYEDHYYHNKKRSRTLAEEQYNDCAKKELAESLGYNYIIVDYREHNPQLALERFMKQYSRIKTEATI